MIDLHSHILFGVDDGARTLEESVEMVRGLAKLGVTTVCATPHFVTDTEYASKRAMNELRVFELSNALAAAEIKVRVVLGNEIYLDRETLTHVEAGAATGINGSRYLLVELPLSGWFDGCEDVMFELMQAGYRLILAHPERYESVQWHLELAEHFVHNGILLQCNLGSLMGRYGRQARRTATALLKRGLVFGMGSDLHRPTSGRTLAAGLKRLSKICSDSRAREILVDNPRQILA